MVFLSIVIPVYNTCTYISECLDSIIDESIEDLEIILIDDCSFDGSREICRGYADKFPFIRLICQPVNQGVSCARNAGIDAASGKFITFIDSDDRVVAGRLADFVRMVGENAEIDLFVGRFRSQNGEFSNDALYDPAVIASEDPATLLEYMVSKNYHPEPCWHYIMQRALLNRFNVRFEPAKIAEDQEFVARILSLARSVGFYSPMYYWYRERDGSLKKSYGSPSTAALLAVADRLRRFRDERGFTGVRRAFLDQRLRYALSLFSARLTLHDDAGIGEIARAIEAGNLAVLAQYVEGMAVGDDGVAPALAAYRARLVEATLAPIRDQARTEIYLYCTGPTGQAVLKTLLDHGTSVRGFFDDNPALPGQTLFDVPIIGSSVLATKAPGELASMFVVVCHPRPHIFEAISRRLIGFGLDRSQIFHKKF